MRSRFGSSKIRAAFSNEMPCFRRLMRFLASSQAKTICIYKIVAHSRGHPVDFGPTGEARENIKQGCDMDKSTIIAKLREYDEELKAAGVEHRLLHGSYARGTANREAPDVDVIADFDQLLYYRAADHDCDQIGQGVSSFDRSDQFRNSWPDPHQQCASNSILASSNAASAKARGTVGNPFRKSSSVSPPSR